MIPFQKKLSFLFFSFFLSYFQKEKENFPVRNEVEIDRQLKEYITQTCYLLVVVGEEKHVKSTPGIIVQSMDETIKFWNLGYICSFYFMKEHDIVIFVKYYD